MNHHAPQFESRWPHRFAWAVVATTFPLIWVGGLVTTYEAGMAVPDWPNTYGYNLLLYPWQTWFFGPWDLFIEHGHRLLGAAVGLLTIGLAATLWFGRLSGVPRWLGIVALVAVIAQGALGGMRVLFDERQLAKIHACTGPAFFALAVALLVATSRAWRQVTSRLPHPDAGRLQGGAALATLLAYLQLVLGAQLRHISISAPPGVFRTFLAFHLLVAAVLTLMALTLALRTWRRFRPQARLRWLATALCGLIVAQLLLGTSTWIVNYSWPWPQSAPAWLAGYTLIAHGQLQTLTTTGHVALGSLIVGTALALTLWSWRLVAAPAAASSQGSIQSRTSRSTAESNWSPNRAELVAVGGLR